MSSIVGLIFSNSNDGEIAELTQRRATGSVPFGGRYRLIDFVLSNMVNAGATKVGVITKSNYQSLMDHIGTGKEWDLARKSGGLILLPPYGYNDSQNTTRVEGLKGVTSFLNRSAEEYAILSDCDIVYNIDFNEVIKFHEANLSDITLVYKKCGDENKPSDVRLLRTNERGRVTGVYSPNEEKGVGKKYMKIMVMKKKLLQTVIAQSPINAHSELLIDLLEPRLSELNVYAFEYEGYYAYIDSLLSYYKNNMKLLERANRDALFNVSDRPIYTKVKDSPPTRYGEGSRVTNSFIADGCSIMGEVENSVIFRGAVIEKGACVKNCIVMQDNYIGANAKMNCVITDKNVVISEKRVLSGAESLPFFISKGRRV